MSLYVFGVWYKNTPVFCQPVSFSEYGDLLFSIELNESR